MAPGFSDGDLVLVEPARPGSVLVPGEVVVARHSYKNLMVLKELDSVRSDGQIELRSPRGEDSRHFGAVPLAAVTGCVRANLTKRERVGPTKLAPEVPSARHPVP